MIKRKLTVLSIITTVLLTACNTAPNTEATSVATTTVKEQITTENISKNNNISDITDVETQTDSITEELTTEVLISTPTEKFDVTKVPEYTNKPYIAVNNNIPYFTDDELTTNSYEYYSDLDSLGRCGVTMACIGKDIMPTEERGAIGQVKPTGWHTIKYDCVDGKYLYNRCHLIGYQLTGENANTKNLITGTRYMNVEGMLPFENMVADYVKETDNHVLYRVTPIYENDNLLASGVLMEAYSVEDKGEDICFCVYVYNAQPGITIDYKTGNSLLTETITEKPSQTPQTTIAATTTEKKTEKQEEITTTIVNTVRYILNTNTKKFHRPDCSSVKQMKDSNKEEYEGTREEVIEKGYDPCKKCHP